MTPTRSLLAALALVLGCALLTPTSPARAEAPSPHYTWSNQPSEVWLRPYSSRPIPLFPTSACWTGPTSSICGDGPRPERADQRKATSHRPLRFWFGRPGWRFRANVASHRAPDQKACQDNLRARRLKPRVFKLPKPAQPGLYEVGLWGHGPEGSVHTTFTWRVGKWRTSNC